MTKARAFLVLNQKLDGFGVSTPQGCQRVVPGKLLEVFYCSSPLCLCEVCTGTLKTLRHLRTPGQQQRSSLSIPEARKSKGKTAHGSPQALPRASSRVQREPGFAASLPGMPYCFVSSACLTPLQKLQKTQSVAHKVKCKTCPQGLW